MTLPRRATLENCAPLPPPVARRHVDGVWLSGWRVGRDYEQPAETGDALIYWRRRCGSWSQNQVEEAVLFRALRLLKRLALATIAVGNRGLGRKELIIGLARKGHDLVFRIDPQITVIAQSMPGEGLLSDALTQQPWLGEVVWNRGEEGKLRCRARSVRATIRYSRSGRKNDCQEAPLNFLDLVPIDGENESLVVATTLPEETLAGCQGNCPGIRPALGSGVRF